MELEIGQGHFHKHAQRDSIFQTLKESSPSLKSFYPVTDLFHLRVSRRISEEMSTLLTPGALLFLEELESKFGERRRDLLVARKARARRIACGEDFKFLEETARIRESVWKVEKAPRGLDDLYEESLSIADLEDATSPTWENVMAAQVNLKKAAERPIAKLVVRPRGWHLEERNIRFDGWPVSASLVDFGLSLFHMSNELNRRDFVAIFSLPKLESHVEARMWNDIFVFAQDRLGLAHGTIQTVVPIETLPAAFEMDEILFELRDHAIGLQTNQWNYLFSTLKHTAQTGDVIYPDREQLTMAVPFLRTHAQRLAAVCKKRGAHAFVKSEAPAEEINAEALLPESVSEGRVTEAGVANNIALALQYLSSWLQGHGSVMMDGMRVDAAAAEFARAQLWQWVKFEVPLSEGARLTRDEFRRCLESESVTFAGKAERSRLTESAALLSKLVLDEELADSFTASAYEILER